MTSNLFLTTPVRFVAEYQLFGDMEGEFWVDLVLGHAKDVEGVILDYKVLYSARGIGVCRELQLVSFTVDVEVPQEATREDIKKIGVELLNGIMNDKDVNVRWVSSLIQEGC